MVLRSKHQTAYPRKRISKSETRAMLISEKSSIVPSSPPWQHSSKSLGHNLGKLKDMYALFQSKVTSCSPVFLPELLLFLLLFHTLSVSVINLLYCIPKLYLGYTFGSLYDEVCFLTWVDILFLVPHLFFIKTYLLSLVIFLKLFYIKRGVEPEKTMWIEIRTDFFFWGGGKKLRPFFPKCIRW